MPLIWILFFATLFLAWFNGANDNMKTVATLVGSETLTAKQGLALTTIMTFAGSLCSVFFAQQLIASFSGKGLVPPDLAGTVLFLGAVAIGAGSAVALATFTGFPISTTHGLTGALVGAGLVLAGDNLNLGALSKTFVIPLLVSPLLALILAALLYRFLKFSREKLGVTKEWCVCAGETEVSVQAVDREGALALASIRLPNMAVAPQVQCAQRYSGHVMRIPAQAILDKAHLLSSSALSFARGLNDTPKIAALMLAGEVLVGGGAALAVGLGIALGGILNSARVGRTMSHKITTMNNGQGFTANIVAAFLVIVASRYGVPVSTTHVTSGGLFGIGAVTGQGRGKVITNVLLSWVLTLPIAALAAAAAAYFLK